MSQHGNHYSTVSTAISKFESIMVVDVTVRKMYEQECRAMKMLNRELAPFASSESIPP